MKYAKNFPQYCTCRVIKMEIDIKNAYLLEFVVFKKKAFFVSYVVQISPNPKNLGIGNGYQKLKS